VKGEGGIGLRGRFHVSVHDVAPRWLGAVRTILDALSPRVGPALSLAVVPAWHDAPLDARRDRELLALVRAAGGEIHVHGLTHRAERARGWVGVLTAGSNEFSGLSRGDALERVARASGLLAALELRPTGLVPPAWSPGPLDAAALGGLGLDHLITLFSARSASGARAPLATVSWDTDRAGLLAPLGEALGVAAGVVVPHAIMHIVLHPADVGRGLLPRALARIDRLLGEGRRPARWSTLLPPGGRGA
jgi:hypothetical protein